MIYVKTVETQHIANGVKVYSEYKTTVYLFFIPIYTHNYVVKR